MNKTFLTISIVIVVVLIAATQLKHSVEFGNTNTNHSKEVVGEEISVIKKVKKQHKSTPESVFGIYMTSWVAGTSGYRDEVLNTFNRDERLNSIVIDIKDDTGRVAFDFNNKLIQESGSIENRVRDGEKFIESLHKMDIYVIGRISVFQDPYFTSYRPDLAVKSKASGDVWRDRKNQSWIDPSSKDYWEYIRELSEAAYEYGFDEINFDYIRFPTDGSISDLSYPISGDEHNKSDIIKNFSTFLDDSLRKKGVRISADIFGISTTDPGDNNIGQLYENFLPHFDAVCPMVYPSHYPEGWEGFSNPAENPYQVIKIALDSAVSRSKEFKKNNPTETIADIRPWLQDFDLGDDYGAQEVSEEISAVMDSGLSDLLIWSPSNRYSI